MADNTFTQIPEKYYLDLTGLGIFWGKVKEYITNASTHLAVSHTDEAGITEKEWITLDSKSVEGAGTTYTIDDSNIAVKFAAVDEELSTIKASAGVTKVTVEDIPEASADNVNYVKFTSESIDDSGKGDIVLKVDESALDEKISNIDASIADRKTDITKLAGEGYTPAENGGEGSWDAGVTYNNIAAISGKLVEIDGNLTNNVVTKVTVEDAGTANYVSFASDNTTGTGEIKLTVDESALDEEITKINKNISDETAARKSDIADLAGSGWDKTTHAWVTEDKPAYTTITELSTQVAAAETKINALTSATHFRGKLDAIPEEEKDLYDGLDYGDIIIVGNKEYIYNADPSASGYTYSKDHWVELGDTSEEITAINSIVAWIDSPITQAQIEALDPSFKPKE